MESLVGNTRRPDISFYRGGRIDITSRVAKLLELKDGDVIDIAMSCEEYYLYVRYRSDGIVGVYEATCHPTKEHSRNFRAYSARLVDAVLKVCNRYSDINVALLPIGKAIKDEDGKTIIPIITLNNLINK